MGAKNQAISKGIFSESSPAHGHGQPTTTTTRTRKPHGLIAEDCITDIISRTIPRHACHLSLFSKIFRSAADSDVVWERFLPPECQSIISKFSKLTLPGFAFQEGALSPPPSLDTQSGKICCMIFPRDLTITWGNLPTNWTWTSPPGARFISRLFLVTSSFIRTVFG
ncbi:F-box protein At2g02240-like [Mangifera indica]|uniref:F-box protein At2g02240-like n=1 Tax=Mangifera indica TaxID=29780 RepID=UPI001CF93C3E|nr:F-box protein At2g02240-like [Mangifera indica]